MSLSEQSRPILLRVAGAAVTGATLAWGAAIFLAWNGRRGARACATTDGVCWTWLDWLALPLVFATSLVVMNSVYKRLKVSPRSLVVAGTVLFGPLPLIAAHRLGGVWVVIPIGAVWAGSLAVSSWDRYRAASLSAAIGLYVAAAGIVFHR